MPSPILYRKSAGFTLPEVLMAALLSALLMAGLAEGMSLFGRELQSVKASSDSGPDEAMSLMTDMSRYGWTVSVPAAGQLAVVDALGKATSFKVLGDALRITRPSGLSGDLVPGVASLSIDTDLTRRLRDHTPKDDYRTWWQVSGAATAPLALESGLPVGLGFMLKSDVPDSYDTVAGVHEVTQFASLDKLVISLAYVGSTPTDPNPAVAGNGSGGKKVTICHVPPGNPANAHTLSVSINAVDAHLAHGDLLGECTPAPDTLPFPQVTLQLFEARAPDDARPTGAPLGSVNLTGQALPVATASWQQQMVGSTTHFVHNHSAAQCAATTASGKVAICHVPPGNPANAHSILISPNAVAAHLAHGDYFGACGAHSTTPSVYTLNVDANPVPYEFNISGLGALIQPGRAYTLMLTMTGPGILYVGATDAASASNSGVAQASVGYSSLLPVASSVPFQLKGLQRITQTDEKDVVSRVSLAMHLDNGKVVRGSASVASQSTVPGDWHGAVPGEVADIHP
jgi:hypothetical protein